MNEEFRESLRRIRWHEWSCRIELGLTPWGECNWPDALTNTTDPNSPTFFEHTVEGLKVWNSVTDTAIVTTMPGKADLYPRLRQAVPGMRIIPSLKTLELLADGFESGDGWARVADEVAAIIQLTPNAEQVLLENEEAVRPFIKGDQMSDIARLGAGLLQLPDDMVYLWYPSIWGNEAEQGRCAEVCRVVEDVLPNVRFIDQRFQGQPAVTDPSRAAADRRLMKIAKSPTLRMAYFYGPDHPHMFWRDDQIHQALLQLRSGRTGPAEAVIYPGWRRWVEAAIALTERLTCET